ncbi:hypothetical protein GCM10022219_27770 [Microbacterium oryzae]|uniref:Hemagglutinin n=1 Tax=Microbacterium oryzae TaxID=743009 RepID=A0A6I6E179_9MICO|nr:hypothetical protein [Microbacterium oryzae]QGU26300.1 hypothetical protein D7D94_00270 [Microbacterium oryzae]
MRARPLLRASVAARGRLTVSALVVLGLLGGSLSAASAAAATTPDDEPVVSATTAPGTLPETVSPRPTPTAAPTPKPSAPPAATPKTTATPAPTPAPEELAPEEMDRLAHDTTPDEAVVEEGADLRARAVSLVGFDPGDIVSDAVFYNSGAMSAAQIQTFLKSKVPTCRSGYTCLKDFRMTTSTRKADAYCTKPYAGAANESAATIIAKVAQACGINPQVLLVMLQKEQGLVTHTWPSDWRYTIAMGMACPDTAACDTRYYGFQNQVYGAARQYQVYATSSWFNWFPVGKSSRVQYHPNASCGSGAVTIKNKATASLYYYTPYQPNAAALRAGYGTGDACSAYGNRNFYNYFTDWFGPTRAAMKGLIRVDSRDIYLLNGTSKVHVTSATLAEYKAAFGAWREVSSDAAAAYPTKGTASLFIRNTTSGEVALLQGGKRHRFSTCTQVAQWGGTCGTELGLAASTYTSAGKGSAMTNVARRSSNGRLHVIGSGSRLVPLYDSAAVAAYTGSSAPYAAVMSAAAQQKYTVAEMRFAPGSWVKRTTSARVYLPTSDRRLVYLPSWGLADEYGLGRGVDAQVAPTVLTGYADKGTLGLLATCGTTTYVAAGGTLHPVRTTGGFPTTTLDGPTCRKLDRSGARVPGRIFVKAAKSDRVYVLDGGRLRHVTTVTAVRRLAGGKWPTILTLSAQTVDFLPKGSTVR